MTRPTEWARSARQRGTLGLLLGLSLLVAVSATGGAQVRVEAGLARDTVGLNESVEYRVTVAGAGVQEVEEPELALPPGLTLFGRSQSSEVSIVSGSVERRTTFTLIYRPYRTGAVLIGPATVRVGRSRYAAAPLTVTVEERPRSTAGAPAGAVPRPLLEEEGEPFGEPLLDEGALEPVFVTNRLDEDEVFVGEQVVLSFAFYQSPRAIVLDQPNYSSARTPGFWTQDFNREPEISRELLNGEPFTIQRFYYALFPLTPGEKEIAPATLTLTLRNPVSFLGRGRTRTLSGDTLRLKVKPLPQEGRPAGFKGAVGSYGLDARVEPRNLERNAPATVVLTVSGAGNVATIPEPRLEMNPGVKVFDPEVKTRMQPRGLTMAGEKEFRYLIIPQSVGELDLGSAAFDFFDPEAAEYRMAAAELGMLKVTAAAGGRPDDHLVSRDIGGIRKELDGRPWPSWQSPFVWLVAALPLAALVVLVRTRRRSRSAPALALPVRGGGAVQPQPGGGFARPASRRTARPVLRTDARPEDVAAAERDLVSYVEERFGVAVGGVSRGHRERTLTAAGAPAPWILRVETALDHLEAVRFAPPPARDAALSEALDSLRLFEEVDRSLERRASARR